MSYGTVVSTEELAANADWRVFDCRHDLAKPEWGAAEYARAHIPGALFAHLDRDLAGPKTGKNGRHPLPEPQAFIAWLGEQGLNPGDQVVAYDAGNGTMAARLWWMLRWVGHGAAAVLDGGLANWLAEGRPVTAAVPRFPMTRYPGSARSAMRADVAYVEAHLGRGDTLLVDSRAPERWRGEAEPIDPEAGRIPGAMNRFCTANLGTDGRFKSAEALRAEFGALLGSASPAQVVHYCGSGVASCHNALAMEIAGLPSSRMYAGSWSEWIADPRRPREKG